MRREALARKYRRLAALRAGVGPGGAELAGLAAEFPGALRELDELPTAEIERRIDELEGVGALRPELVAIGLFHDQLLGRKARDASAPLRGRRPSREALAQVALELAVTVAEAHRLVFPYARVRRGLAKLD